MPPSGLNHGDLGIGEEMDRSMKQIPRRRLIGLENADKFAISRFLPKREGAGLKSSAIDSVNQLDVEAALTQFSCARCGEFASVISRIVEDLDLQQIFRVIEFAD